MKKIAAVCFICLLSLSLSLAIFSSALAQGDPDSTSKITLQYLLDEPTVDRGAVTLAGPDGSREIYDSVAIPGLNNQIVPGEPVLPVRTARILIPYGEEVQEVKVVVGNEKYLGSVSIRPGQNSVPIGFTKNCTGCNPQDNWTTTPELSLLNEEIYGSENPYPEKAYSVLGVQTKYGYKILYINLYPIKYIPKTGEAYSFGAFDVEVTTAPAETLDLGLFRGIPEDREDVDMIVDNPEKTTTYPTDLAQTGTSLLLDEDYDYVIITNQYLKDAPGPYNFQALADWKTNKSVKAAIVTVEDIYANYRRSFRQDDQEVIREFIKDAYYKNKIKYVLLGGDGDGARIGGETWDAIVPARGLWAWAYEPEPSCCIPPQDGVNLLSDLYYACLDGNYDYNKNGIYGEEKDGENGDWVDLAAEVYVGRAPVDNYDELSNFVRKTIAYESTKETDRYLTGIWMVGEYMEPLVYPKVNPEDPESEPRGTTIWQWGASYKDLVKPLFPEDRFYVETLYDRDTTGDECNCNQYDWTRAALITEINANYIHAINHVGTSNFCDIVAYVMKMGYNHADALNNTKYFFGYSQAGFAASFDNRDPAGVYLPHDCVLEHFVTAPAGAFAFIGNTRYGLVDLYMDTPADSPSQKFDYAFWHEMFYGPTSSTNIGKINQLSKETLIGQVNVSDSGGWNMRYCYYGIVLLGDPETPFIIPAATLGTTEEMPEVAEVVAPVTEAPVAESSKAASDAEKVTQISPSLDMPDLFGDGMGFDANTFEFEEMEFDFGDDFGDSMNF